MRKKRNCVPDNRALIFSKCVKLVPNSILFEKYASECVKDFQNLSHLKKSNCGKLVLNFKHFFFKVDCYTLYFVQFFGNEK